MSDSFSLGLLEPSMLAITFDTVFTNPAFDGAHEGAPTQMVLDVPPMSVPVATVNPGSRPGIPNQAPESPFMEKLVVASSQ